MKHTKQVSVTYDKDTVILRGTGRAKLHGIVLFEKHILPLLVEQGYIINIVKAGK